MDDGVKLLIAMWVKNSITLICFTILAIVFEKWWLVLIGVLFFTYIDKK